jgi:hypothetical protein
LADAGRRADQSEPVSLVFGSEDRERQRAARDGEDAIAGAMQQGEGRSGTPAENTDHAGADRMCEAGEPGGDERIETAQKAGFHHPGGDLGGPNHHACDHGLRPRRPEGFYNSWQMRPNAPNAAS